MPVYNRLDVFQKALDSVLRQTYRPIEVIVVDDGSEQEVRNQKSPKSVTSRQAEIRNQIPIIWIRQENKGAPAARNRGFFESKGEFVIFWDADIIAVPELLEKMYQTLVKHPEASYAYCDYYFGKKKMSARWFDRDKLKRLNYIITTSLIRRSDFPGWDESLKKFQDWDVWLTMLEKNKIGVYVSDISLQVSSTRGIYSSWLPVFAYHAPWRWLPVVRGLVQRYEVGKEIILMKHQLKK